MEMSSIEKTDRMNGLSQLTARLPGKVVLPSDSQYDKARSAWNLAIDQHPEVIVYVDTSQDVVEALTYAHQYHFPIAVQSTGHGVFRRADGAMLINTSRMKDIQVNPVEQTAYVGAGVKWGEVLPLAQQYGLAPLLGSSPDVGVVGYSLGGGIGWLVRKHGLSADSILRIEIVTPDGVIRQASLEENSDLFWALRGGGGGFGVVTGMEIRLYPVTQVYAGNLLYPPEMAREVIQRFRQWTANAPDELSASIVLMNYPPMPELPPFLSGKSFVIVRGCYAGPIEEGEKLLTFWRSWKTPVMDEFNAIPFSESASISKDPVDPMPDYVSGAFLNELNDESIDALIQNTLPQGGLPPLVFTEVRLMGGAVSRVDPDANAFSNREEKYIMMNLGVPITPEMSSQIEGRLAQLRRDLAPALSGKVYMNFTEGDESRQRTRDGFSQKAFQRLQEIKAKYDPDNSFSYGYEISPAASM